MNSKRRWYELLLPGLVILLLLSAGIDGTANASEYDDSGWEGYGDANDDGDNSGPGWTRAADSSYDADESARRCECSASVTVSALDNALATDADSYAVLLRDWTWNGPPGEAPGGNLTWSQDVDKNETATSSWGQNEETAISSSSAEGQSWTVGTEGSSYADIDVWAYLEDGTTVDGDYDWDSSPSAGFDEGDPYSDTDPPQITFVVDGWDYSAGNTESIASGTTYIYFAGGVECYAFAATDNDGTQKSSWAGADATVVAAFSGVFTPNE